ncbi:MAG: sulfotransferase domain-containing protein [Candidatus Woesearchaeota archaeon]
MVNYIISGCPRSGTSMLMRILHNAGFPIAKDEKRKADRDNVHGYFEVHNIINKLKDNPELVFEYDNKALKVTHFGLQYLPEREEGGYRIIYVERDMEEVLDSMEKMMGQSDEEREETRQAFLKFDRKVRELMDERKDIEHMIVSHRKLVKDPEPEIDRITGFYGIKPSKKDAMLKAIDPESYRNRRS